MISKRDRKKSKIIKNIKKTIIITKIMLDHLEAEEDSGEVEAVDNKILMEFKEMKKHLDNFLLKTFNLIILKKLGEEEI